MDREQELRPAHNISPAKKCNSTDPAVYKQFLGEKSRQNALKRHQEELESRSAKVQREQGWVKYVNGENKNAPRKPAPSMPVTNDPPVRRKSTTPQSQSNIQHTSAPFYSGAAVMPRSGPMPVADSHKHSVNKFISQNDNQQRRENNRETWGLFDYNESLKPAAVISNIDNPYLTNTQLDQQQSSTTYMESLQPGTPFNVQKQSPAPLDCSTQEIVFHGTGTMFEEPDLSYDFEATCTGLDEPVVDINHRDSPINLNYGRNEKKHIDDLKDTENDHEKSSTLENSERSTHDESVSVFGSLLNTREGTDSSASMSIPDSLMILAEKMDQLPPSCFQSHDSLPTNDNRLPPRNQDEPKNDSKEDPRPRSSFHELRQHAHDIKATFTKLSSNDPSIIASYVLNMPQEFQMKLMHLIRKGINGDQQSLGELHVSFQQPSFFSELGETFVTPTSLCNKSLDSTPTREVRRVKEIVGQSYQTDSDSVVIPRANLPTFDEDFNLKTYKSSPVPTSPKDNIHPKQSFQATPTPVFSNLLRNGGLDSPDSPEEKPITSVNQHTLQRATLLC